VYSVGVAAVPPGTGKGDFPASIVPLGSPKADNPSTETVAPAIAVVFRKSLLDVVIYSP
jgi:hypothetical protein